MAKVKISARVIDDYQSASISAFGQYPPTINTVSNRDILYQWFWKLSECRGIVNTIVADVFGEGYEIDAPSDAKKKKVETFLKNNQFNRNAKAVLRDELITGDGYMGLAALTDADVLSAMDTVWRGTFHKKADQLQKQMTLAKVRTAKPDLFSPQVLFPLMSRSIKINYDEHGKVLNYVQIPKSKAQPIEFAPEEVIHFAYEPIGDQIYGTSPFQSSIYDLTALWYAKNYGGVFFQNDATPSFIFKLPDEAPDGQNYKRFVEELKKHKQNPHKSMVITGNVEIERVNPMNKDLEFSNFIDKYTQRMLMAWGITARFSHLFTGRLETAPNLEGYYKFINGVQKDWEEILNQRLFEQFGVEFFFKRVYKRDESREADIITKLVGKPVLTVQEGREYLGYKPLSEAELQELMEVNNPNSLSNNPMDDVASGDARSEQNADEPSAPHRPKGDKPVNNKGEKP